MRRAGRRIVVALIVSVAGIPLRAEAGPRRWTALEVELRKILLLNRSVMDSAARARQRAPSGRIRAFARRVELDHRFAEARTLEVGARLGLDLRGSGEDVRDTNAAGAKELLEMTRELKMLESLTGRSLERAFVRTMERAHRRAESMLQRCAASAPPPVQDLLARLIPIFRQDLDLAVALQGASQSRVRVDRVTR